MGILQVKVILTQGFPFQVVILHHSPQGIPKEAFNTHEHWNLLRSLKCSSI